MIESTSRRVFSEQIGKTTAVGLSVAASPYSENSLADETAQCWNQF